jgi:predicted amidohydrolase YtcJ
MRAIIRSSLRWCSAWRRAHAFIALSTLYTVLVFPAVAASAQPADFVFRNGAVYTVTNEKPWAEAVAVAGGRIVYVGTNSEVVAYIGKNTQVIDLAKGMLLPGFVDAHAHLSGLAGLFDVPLTLRGKQAPDVLAVVRKYVAEHPDERLIRGSGFIVEDFLPDGPNKRMLDTMIPDRPAVMRSIDGHYMWVNSRTLQLAGINANTPDPEPGVSWFQRFPNSREPTGFVIEGKAIAMVIEALQKQGFPFESRERLLKGLTKGLPIVAAAGITTVFDAGAPRNESDFYSTLQELESRHELPVRVFGAHILSKGYEPDRDPIQDFNALRRQYHSDTLAAQMIKVVLDGSDNDHTAYMLEPYADNPQTRGQPLWPLAAFNDLVQRADVAGIDLHIHVVGDAAIRMALDAFAHAAEQDGSRDRRNTLAHVNFIHPDDIPRFRQLGVIWNSTPAWNMMSPRNITILHAMGEPRFSERVHRVQAAVEQGVIMDFGSDLESVHPGSIYRPLDQMEIGRTRQALGNPEFPVMPEVSQRMTIAELIRCYTINGAYMLRMEDQIGSISVGKRADLVVLEKNLFDVSPYAIHADPIRLTMMNGTVTYRAEDAAHVH